MNEDKNILEILRDIKRLLSQNKKVLNVDDLVKLHGSFKKQDL